MPAAQNNSGEALGPAARYLNAVLSHPRLAVPKRHLLARADLSWASIAGLQPPDAPVLQWPAEKADTDDPDTRCPDTPWLDLGEVCRKYKQLLQEEGNYRDAGEYFFVEMWWLRLTEDNGWRRAGYWLFEKLAGYGERPWWVVRAMALIVLVCAWLQGWIGIKEGGGFAVGPHLEWPSWAGFERFFTSLYFSVITFTTTGYGDLKPTPGLGRFVSATEAACGVVLMALFMVCMARKFSR